MDPSRPEILDRTFASKQLAGWFLGLTVLWLLVLPWIASRPSVEAHLRWLDEQGIDPSAMYYTELDAMKPILSRLNRSPGGSCE